MRFASAGASVFGTIESWSSIDRRGTIVARQGDEEVQFTIPNARSFETLMPTMLRSLDGSKVSFKADFEKKVATDIVIDLNTVRRLHPEAFPKEVEVTVAEPPLPSHLQTTKPLRPEESVTREGVDLRYTDFAPPSDSSARDLRLSALMDTKPKIKKRTANFDAKEEELADRQVVAETLKGKIVAWSILHRSGLVVVEKETGDDRSYDPSKFEGGHEDHFLVRNVDSFESAMPGAVSLRGAEVQFTGVTYGNAPGRQFAESIQVLVMPPEEPLPSAANAKDKKSFVVEDEVPAPAGKVFGVVGRWSGGQGTIEASNQQTYFIESSKDFLLMDPSAVAIKGAVVTFTVDPATPKFARTIDIISEMNPARLSGQRGFTDAMPVPGRRSASGEADQGELPQGDDIPWRYGRLVMWSTDERQGVIAAEVDKTSASDSSASPTDKELDRFLIRDASADLHEFDEVKAKIRRGIRVKFLVREGTRIAQHIVLSPITAKMMDKKGDEQIVELDEFGDPLPEEQLKLDDPELIENKHMKMSMFEGSEEATGSPSATNHWVDRFEKVGLNMKDYKTYKESLTPPSENDPLFDEDNDNTWIRDPNRNKKINDSNTRFSDVSAITSSGLLKMSATMQQPEKREKFKKKLEDRASAETKQYAMEKAKEAAPRYLKAIKDARAKNEEPVFSFQ